MTIWLTSDEHHGHSAIIRHCQRPFASAEDMTEALIANHNAIVQPGDEVWHLGDFAWDEKLIAPVLSRLNGTHRLIAGNHDRCHECHKKHRAATRRYLGYGFAEVLQRHVMHVPELGDVLLTHMPRAESADTRYPEFRPRWDGWIFHGHVHERWLKRDRSINCGVDVWKFAPVRLEEVVEEALR